MKSVKYYMLIVCLVIACFAFADETRIRSFFPSPTGLYNKLRVVPHSPPPLTGSCKTGSIYVEEVPHLFDSSYGRLHYCDQGVWRLISSNDMGVWHQSDSNIFLSHYFYNAGDTLDMPMVGIGNELTPDSLLEINLGGDTTVTPFLISSSADTDGDVLIVRNNGHVGIGNNALSDYLTLGVDGEMGATEYCNEDGTECAVLDGTSSKVAIQYLDFYCECHGGPHACNTKNAPDYVTLKTCSNVSFNGSHPKATVQISCPQGYKLISGTNSGVQDPASTELDTLQYHSEFNVNNREFLCTTHRFQGSGESRAKVNCQAVCIKSGGS